MWLSDPHVEQNGVVVRISPVVATLVVERVCVMNTATARASACSSILSCGSETLALAGGGVRRRTIVLDGGKGMLCRRAHVSQEGRWVARADLSREP